MTDIGKFTEPKNKMAPGGGDSALIRRVCATGVLNFSPCSGVGKLKKDGLLYCIVLYCILIN